jgi:3-dehydroquinate dehydratase/shikimate dehydrogenase
MTSTRPTRICVPVCEASADALKNAARAAAIVGDLVEFRLDCLDALEFETAIKRIDELSAELLRPAILTFRPNEQGGHRGLDYASRSAFWNSRQARSDNEFFDIELDLAAGLMSTRGLHVAPDWSRIICSHHDFAGVPADLEQIYELMGNTPARILKIAVHAQDITDCLPIFHLLERSRSEGRELIAIAMGNAGVATRVLGPSRGSFLTYGSLGAESATAPGQITAPELRSLYRIDKITEKTSIFGLVGKPAMHSVSPHMHNAALESANIDGVYLPFEVGDVVSFFKRMVHPGTREIDWNLRGLSITAPHKLTVMDCLDWIEPIAKDIGAVNTVVVEADRLLGYNTDAAGLIAPLIRKLGSLEGLRVAVIGAGGAASAAVFGLEDAKAKVTIFARNMEKGKQLAERFNVSCESLSSASFAEYDVVINSTPLGSVGETMSKTPCRPEQLAKASLVYDLVYNPTETRLLRDARTAGCGTLGGLEMLVAQACRQFKLWTGESATPTVMHAAAAGALRASS